MDYGHLHAGSSPKKVCFFFFRRRYLFKLSKQHSFHLFNIQNFFSIVTRKICIKFIFSTYLYQVPGGVMVSMIACRASGQGSNPTRTILCFILIGFFFYYFVISFLALLLNNMSLFCVNMLVKT